MNTILIVLIAALPIAYSVVYIVHCFRKHKISAAIGTGFLSLLAVSACVLLGLIY